MAKRPSKLLSFFLTLGFFFGGAALGAALASWCAPKSALATVTSFLAFPLAMFLGFPAWLGSAFITLIFNWTHRRKSNEMQRAGAFIPPGSWVFLPVSLGVIVVAGLIVAIVAERTSFFGTLGIYTIFAAAYGAGMWRAARTGLLPFPDEA
jgi:hypothetical protein